MTTSARKTPKCPLCRAAAAPRRDNRAFPFCSDRCQLIDLGRWLDEDYRVPDRSLDTPDGAEPHAGADEDGH